MLLAPLGTNIPNVRFNDGRTNRQGHFLTGTMHLHRTDNEPVVGGLFWLNPGGRAAGRQGGRAAQITGDILTSNGPYFSLDGRILYFADSTRRMIWSFDYVPAADDETPE
jgi:L-arabinonolactonase